MIIELDKPREFSLDPNALEAVEEIMGIGYASFMMPPVYGIRVEKLVLWAGMKEEDPTLTPQKIGQLLKERQKVEPGFYFKIPGLIVEEMTRAGFYSEAVTGGDTKN
jgi:hypothetical protein